MNYQDGKREVGEEAGKKWQKYNFSFVEMLMFGLDFEVGAWLRL